MSEVQMIPLIKCSYGHPCFISMEKMSIPGIEVFKNVLKLDFNIKKYKVCNGGWRDYDFPENIVINDKLYLDEELKDKVIEVLDSFLETGWLQNIATETTNRGFSLLEMKDLKGNTISFQDSSAGSGAYIWFGCRTDKNIFLEKNSHLEEFKFHSDDVLVEDRMHLSKKDARTLKKIIKQVWKEHVNATKKTLRMK